MDRKNMLDCHVYKNGMADSMGRMTGCTESCQQLRFIYDFYNAIDKFFKYYMIYFKNVCKQIFIL